MKFKLNRHIKELHITPGSRAKVPILPIYAISLMKQIKAGYFVSEINNSGSLSGKRSTWSMMV
jgi:hypothetical protein